MVSETCKKRAHDLVEKAKNKNKVIKYSDFCQTKTAKDAKLTSEENSYYISKNEEETR